MSEPLSQLDAVDYFKNCPGTEAATVGEYIRVVPQSEKKSCFGPKPDQDVTGWMPVEIDWEHRSFLLAPKNYDEAEDQ